MKKRLLSLLLALAMVLSLVPFGVVAEGEDLSNDIATIDEGSKHVHCMCGKTLSGTCTECGTEAVEWTAWGDDSAETSTLPNTEGNYYLVSDIAVVHAGSTKTVITNGNIAIDLCGHNVTGSGERCFYINTGSMTITDCSAEEEKVGKFSGFANSGANAPFNVSNGAVLNIYGGKITGNTNTSGSTGIIAVPSGATLNMYGGEISGNTTVRGTVKGGTTAEAYYINIYGGTITGNYGTGTGSMGGGAGIYAFVPVTVGGDAKIYGNTGADTAKCQDIFLRNDGSFSGKLLLSVEKPLKTGAQLGYGLYVAEADTADLTGISGAPEKWKNIWVSYNGEKVGYADGKFFVDDGEADTEDPEIPAGHIHCLCGKTTSGTCAKCGSQAVEWTATDTMPAKDAPGYYYLTGDVSPASHGYATGEFALCLCGHNINAAAGQRTLEIYTTFSITDCSATPGKITGCDGSKTYGQIRVNQGGVLNFYNGHITGNTAKDEGIIYLDGSSNAALAGGIFNMYGGEISGNTTRRGAVYAVLTGTNKAQIHILGGTITGNTGTGTGNRKGGAGVYSFVPVEIGGDAKIYGNTAAEGGADLFLRNDSTYTGKVVVSDTVPLTPEASIEYTLWTAESDLTDLKYITGAPAQWDSAWVTYNGQKVGYVEGKFFIDTSAPKEHVHCLCGKTTVKGKICASCGSEAVEWTKWEQADTLPKDNGYYYLAQGVKTGAVTFTGDTNTAICLCGQDITSANGWKIMNVEKGATVTITDCAKTVGKITGAYQDKNGSALRVNAGSTINFYNGHITGNKGITGGDGTIYVDKGTATTVGGTFNMYGGEISGNSARRGGAIYGVLSSGAKTPVIRILGGTITGNEAFGTGSTGGGGAICAFNPVEVGGNAVISGNTAQVAGAENILLRNDKIGSYAAEGKIIVSASKPLTSGAQISYTLKVADPDPFNLQYITGAPDQWSSGWVTYNGDAVNYKDGKFYTKVELIYSDHNHDGHKWISMTNANGQVPEASGYYVLDEDVKLPSLLLLSNADVTLCLNGHTLTAADNAGHFDLQPGTKLTICDCAGGGVITGGKGANGGVIRAREGSEVYLQAGTIENNTASGNGGFIYLNAASGSNPGAKLVMTGGTIRNNYGAMGAAVRMGAPTGSAAGPTFIMEGGTICNNESPTNGGAIHAASGATVKLLGGVIENNTTGTYGTVSINGASTLELAGTKILNNTAKSGGAGLYIKGGATVTMTGGEISGNIATGSGGGIAAVESTLNIEGGTISGNTSTGGGGLNLLGCKVHLGKVTVRDNVSSGSAGGMYIARSGSVISDVTIDGAQIIGNSCKTSGGGIFVYMNNNILTMNSGLIEKNKASDGGGVLVQRICTFTLNGGVIRDNQTQSNGGGVYASIDSIFVMNGGKIYDNYATKNGGGVYALRSKVTLNGGVISQNIAQSAVGGVYFSCATGYINGTWITENRALTGSGGGVMLQSATMKVDGVPTKFNCHVVMDAGLIGYNTTPKAAGGLLVQSEGSVFDFNGGEISHNVATKFAGGVYVGTKAVFNMHGGKVSYNVTENDTGGGIRHDGGSGNYTGGEICYNTSTRSGGGLLVSGVNNKVVVKNVKIYGNTAKVAAGVLLQSKGCQLIMENCEIYENKATQNGAGVYVNTYCTFTANNCHIHDNVAQADGGGFWSWATSTNYLNNCLIENNQAANQGGGIWTRADAVFLDGTTVRNNTAGGDGGGVYAGRMSAASDGWFPHMNMTNTLLEGNVSGGQGGGAFMAVGAMCTLKDVKFLNNIAAAEAGAIRASDEFSMHNVTATGNTSGGEGFAVYLDDALYDGHSYINGLMEMSGDMQIHDNPGGDLYLGEETCLIITEQGIAKETKVNVTLHSGLLTQMVWGAYNYEGGDQVYTITCGDRSITDPEIPVKEEEPVEQPTEEPTEAPTQAPTDPTEAPTQDAPEDEGGKGMLAVAIGAIVAVIAAAALIIVLASKKKKAAK